MFNNFDLYEDYHYHRFDVYNYYRSHEEEFLENDEEDDNTGQ